LFPFTSTCLHELESIEKGNVREALLMYCEILIHLFNYFYGNTTVHSLWYGCCGTEYMFCVAYTSLAVVIDQYLLV